MKLRWISMVVALVLVLYLLVSTVASLLGGSSSLRPNPTATPTRTPRPTFTAVATASPNLQATPTRRTENPSAATAQKSAEPSRPSPTPATTSEPVASPTVGASPSATRALPATTEATSTPLVHTVAFGDTLLGIAIRYGVTTESIAEANGLTDENLIYIGQPLVIPPVRPGGQTQGTEPQASPGVDGTPAPIERSFIRVVRAGETLAMIAAEVGLTVDEIARANGLKSTNLIVTGQRLIIPATSGTPTPASAGAARTHLVRAGENLTTIAQQYGVTIEAIMKANDLTSPDTIYAGQRLTIP